VFSNRAGLARAIVLSVRLQPILNCSRLGCSFDTLNAELKAPLFHCEFLPTVQFCFR
jgi:hypothetical protein